MLDIKMFVLYIGLCLKCEAVILLNASEYYYMPDIFVIDDYHACIRQSQGIYCTVTLELNAEPMNALYNQIQAYSAGHINHFNHTILDRGICVQKSCKDISNYVNNSEKNFQWILEECLNKTIWDEYRLKAQIKTIHHCTKATENKKADQYDFIAAVVVISIILMNLVGTCYHFYAFKNNFIKKQSQSLILFSISKNWNDFINNINQIQGFNGLRLTPSYAVVMLLSMSWLRHIGSGPLWGRLVEGRVRDCRRYFWHHMFYINNYIPEDVHCLAPTWFLAADMQLFIVGLLVLCLRRRRMFILFSLLALGYIGPIADVWLEGLDPVVVARPEFMRTFSSDSFNKSHIRGHNNINCYITGMIVAFLVKKLQKKYLKFQSKWLVCLSNLWLLSIFFLLLSNGLLYAKGPEPSLLSRLVFAVLHRMIFAALIALLIIVIMMNCDSTFTRLLAWSGWELPSKLTYSVYLIHMELIYILIGTRPGKGNNTALNLFTTFFGIAALSFILAIPLYIFVESPFKSLLRRKTTEKNLKEDTKDD